jgi:urease accessory protein
MLLVDHLPDPPTSRESRGPRAGHAASTLGGSGAGPGGAARTAKGRELALALPTGSVLEPGRVLVIGAGFYVEVEAQPEPVLAVRPRDAAEAIRTAFEVGNRHFSLALDGERLLVPDDSAMRQLLERLAVAYEPIDAVFTPVGSGHRHEPGVSPTDGHTHPHGDGHSHPQTHSHDGGTHGR